MEEQIHQFNSASGTAMACQAWEGEANTFMVSADMREAADTLVHVADSHAPMAKCCDVPPQPACGKRAHDESRFGDAPSGPTTRDVRMGDTDPHIGGELDKIPAARPYSPMAAQAKRMELSGYQPERQPRANGGLWWESRSDGHLVDPHMAWAGRLMLAKASIPHHLADHKGAPRPCGSEVREFLDDHVSAPMVHALCQYQLWRFGNKEGPADPACSAAPSWTSLRRWVSGHRATNPAKRPTTSTM